MPLRWKLKAVNEGRSNTNKTWQQVHITGIVSSHQMTNNVLMTGKSTAQSCTAGSPTEQQGPSADKTVTKLNGLMQKWYGVKQMIVFTKPL